MNRTPFADSQRMDILRKSASYIIEYGLITYLGFCEPGTAALTDDKWSILRIVESSKIPGTDLVPQTTEMKWAEGMASYNLKMSDHETYNYKFPIF
jgi:hypothetical protein